MGLIDRYKDRDKSKKGKQSNNREKNLLFLQSNIVVSFGEPYRGRPEV